MKKKKVEFVIAEETAEAIARVIGSYETENDLLNRVKDLAKQNKELEAKATEAKVIHAGGRTVRTDSVGQLVVPVTVDIPERYVTAMTAKAAANNMTLERYISIVTASGIEAGWYS